MVYAETEEKFDELLEEFENDEVIDYTYQDTNEYLLIRTKKLSSLLLCNNVSQKW